MSVSHKILLNLFLLFLTRFHDHFITCNPPGTNKDPCRPFSKLIGLPPSQELCIWLFYDLQTHLVFFDLQTNFYSILWLTDIFSIFWLTDTLENGKAGATVKHLWVIWLYTVDPVGAKHKTKINFEKIFL